MKHILFLCMFFSVLGGNGQELEILEPSKPESVPFAIIENVPVYPGCKGSDNAELKKCMSNKISQYVGANFDLGIIKFLGLPAGPQRISVQFKIDKQGDVVEVRARASHEKIEKEAIRVVSSLPQLLPGMQKGEAVGVLYSLPILFKIMEEETRKERKARLKAERKAKNN